MYWSKSCVFVSVCMRVFEGMCVTMCVFVCVCVCVCVCMRASMHVCCVSKSVSLCIYVCLGDCACLSACLSICTCACMCTWNDLICKNPKHLCFCIILYAFLTQLKLNAFIYSAITYAYFNLWPDLRKTPSTHTTARHTFHHQMIAAYID